MKGVADQVIGVYLCNNESQQLGSMSEVLNEGFGLSSIVNTKEILCIPF